MEKKKATGCAALREAEGAQVLPLLKVMCREAKTARKGKQASSSSTAAGSGKTARKRKQGSSSSTAAGKARAGAT